MKTNIQLRLIALLLAAPALLSTTLHAQQMNYQGRLTEASGNPVVDGQRTLTFNLYTAPTGGTLTWGPFITDGAAGNGHSAQADLVNGRFNVILGPNDTAGRSLVSGFGGGTRYLEIKDGLNAPMSPRQQVLAAPEALHALLADTVMNGAIGTAQLADGSVTAAKIAGGTGVWIGSGANVYRAAGNVGIGTSTPGFPLTFPNTLGDKVSLYGQSGNSWGFGIQAGVLQIHSDSAAGDIAFGHGSSAAMTETMRIKGDGNIGMGTATPAALLNVVGPAGAAIRVGGPGSGAAVSLDLAPYDPAGQYLTPAARIQATDDGGYGAKIDFMSKTFGAPGNPLVSRMSIDHNGNVGIGAPTPSEARLVVRGTAGPRPQAPGNIAAFSNTGAGGTQGDNLHTFTLNAIYAPDGYVVGGAFVAISDERIKVIEGRSDSASDLQTLRGIEITDYRFKDIAGKGNAPQKKVVAQQVEKVFPQAISRQTDVVPDIYQSAPIQNGWVSLATNLKKGERVKLIAAKGEATIHEVLEVAKDKFRTDFKPEGDKVFVYGREVKDFRTVDYEAIAMLNVSATQALAERLEKLEKGETHLAELERKVARLANLEQELADMKRVVARLLPAGDASDTAKLASPAPRTESAKDAAHTAANLER